MYTALNQDNTLTHNNGVPFVIADAFAGGNFCIIGVKIRKAESCPQIDEAYGPDPTKATEEVVAGVTKTAKVHLLSPFDNNVLKRTTEE